MCLLASQPWVYALGVVNNKDPPTKAAFGNDYLKLWSPDHGTPHFSNITASHKSMTESFIAQHHVATKVGGRRLSVTTKHRPQRPEERSSAEREEKEEGADYPRPSPNTADAPKHGHNNYEEEVPHKKEKKQNSERKTQEYAYGKSETTRPTRVHNAGQKTVNMRISQPTGKGFNV